MAMEQAIGDGVDQRTSVAQILETYRLEQHAKEALALASRYGHDHRIDARAALWGVLEARTEGGTAFRKLRELIGKEPPRAGESYSPAEVYLNEALVDSLGVAREFWKRRGQVWGRDLITWALLAKDPSLDAWLT